MTYVAFSGTAGLFTQEPEPFPLSRASPFPLSFSHHLGVFLAVLGCLPRVEAAMLRRVPLHSCRGRVRAVRCEEETFLPTRRPQRVRSSRGGRDTRLLRPKHDPLPRLDCGSRVPGESAPETPVWPEGDIGLVATRLADSGAEGKTVVRTVACESLAELSLLVWDAEDSLEFYPAQASQSFFSLPRSLRPRNRLGRSGVGP
ncbi:hypothetical protein Taro_000305 [Colocasia esculenta]|uniref:Uncharacterized protein n=1 Tax=Colocasia esculenta TaxID=4460 RepID=A0A843TBU4_COLES|nr:hypothetical protein [Colocasia esculenta]